jgi:hypothetical protein
MIRFVMAGVACAFIAVAAPAGAADIPVKAAYKAPPAELWPRWFVEGRVGAGFGWYDDLQFLNPLGVAAGGVPAAGDYIVLSGQDRTSTSFTGGVGVGYFFAQQFFARLSYNYFGTFEASGFASFPPLSFRQDLETRAHGLLFGLGANFNLTQSIFIEPTIEAGIGFLRSSGVQGANLGLAGNNFPVADRTNFIAGGGLGIGYRWHRNFDLIASGNYYWLGKADTGVTGAPPPGIMNPGEQLQSDLSVITATLTGRVKF